MEPVCLYNYLPDMDKQGSIGELRPSATRLTDQNFEKGDEMRERSRGLQHNHLSLSHCKNECSNFGLMTHYTVYEMYMYIT